MTFKIFKGFLYLRKSAKGEMSFSRPRRHKILSNFCGYSKHSYGKKVERMKFIFGRYAGHRSNILHRNLKILQNDAIKQIFLKARKLVF